ncbi:unnamed protein product [Closterium sp. NIES-53]
MPFGLTNAPATFQAKMNHILRPLLDECVVVYLDDILIYSRDMKQHIEHLRRVFEILRREKFYVKISKSKFALKKFQFLGHMVSDQGVHVDPKKIEAVRTWKTPENVKELQQFLGFANYYNRFVPQYAKIATPLTNLLKKNTPFKWEDVHQQAMEQLKTALTSAPVLILPDTEKDYVIEADASDQAVGAVLMQDQGKGLQPIAYLSKKLHGAELNYPIHDKEALAIITACKTWRCYLKGRKTTVYTDHCRLKYLKTQPTLSRRQVRWIDFLETHFDYDIVYKPGHKNKADALSRPGHVAAIQIEGMNLLLKGLFTHGYTIDPEIPLAEKKKLLQWDHDVALRKGSTKIWVPNYPPLRQLLLEEFHDVLYAGHFGSNKTLTGIAKVYCWPHMANDVQKFVTSCDTCQRMESSKQKKAVLLQPLPVPEQPWQVVSLDFITGLPPTNAGHDAILVVIDKFSKMGHLIPTHTTAHTEETAQLFLKHIISQHGIPTTLISDKDPKFTSKFWKELMSLMGTRLAMSSAYHPQTNGQTERLNQIYSQKRLADRHRRDRTIAVGNHVLLDTCNLNLGHLPSKLRPRFCGPFLVEEQVTPVTFRLRLPASWKIHNAFHVQLLKPYQDPSKLYTGRQPPPPPPVLVNDELEYEVESVLAHRRRRHGALEFLVRWKGYDPSEDSWPERRGDNEPGPGLSPRWRDAEDCPYDTSATGAEDDVEWWAADGLPEDLPVPSFPPPNKKRPHPSKQNRDARPPSPRSKPSTHKRNSYTSQEKLQWIAKLEFGAVSVRRMSRDTGISRKSLSEWKSRKGELEGAHGARKRLHGHGRASWYRDMEIEVYSRVLAHRKKCLAVSVGRLQKWSHEVMKILHPDVKWAGSQRWTEHFRRRWNLTTRAKTRIGQKLSSGESVFVLSLSFMAAYDLRNSNFLLLVSPTLPLQSVRHRSLRRTALLGPTNCTYCPRSCCRRALPCPAQRYRAALPRAALPRTALLPRVLRCCPRCPAVHAQPCWPRDAVLAARDLRYTRAQLAPYLHARCPHALCLHPPTCSFCGGFAHLTLDPGATRCFFRDCTTVTPLTKSVPVSLADPSGGLVVARASTVLPCPAGPSCSLTGFHLPSFSKNLVSNAVLQDQFITVTTPGGDLVAICTDSRIGENLTTFTRSLGSGLYTLTSESAQAAASGQHHRLGHPSLPRVRGMHSRLLVSSLPKSLPPLSRSLAPSCLPCVEGRQRAAPNSSFPLTTAPLQTLHMDMWGPAYVRGQDQERYFLLVVDDYTRYTTVFPLGGEFSTGLLRDYCRAEGFAQLFTLPASPQQNGIAERLIGLVMELNLWPRVSVPETSPTLRWTEEVGDTSAFRVWGALSLVRDPTSSKLSPRTLRCIFLGFPTDTSPWQFYHPASCHVLSSQDVIFDESVCFYRLHPHVSSPLSPPPLFLVPGPPSVDPLPPQGPAPSAMSQVDPPPLVDPWEVSSDTSDPAEGGDPAADNTAATRRSPRLETPPGFPPRPSSLPPQPVAVDSSVAGGGDPEGADSGGAGPQVADGSGDVGALARGSGIGQQQQSRRQETLSSQQLRDWVVWRGSPGGGGYRAAGAGGPGAAGAGGTGAGGTGGNRATGTGGTGAASAGGASAGGASAGGAGGTGAVGAGGTRVGGAGGTRAAGVRGAGAAGAGGASARAASAGGAGAAGAGGASAGGARAVGARGTGAAGARGAGAAGTGGARAASAGGAGAAGAGGARAEVLEPRRVRSRPSRRVSALIMTAAADAMVNASGPTSNPRQNR